MNIQQAGDRALQLRATAHAYQADARTLKAKGQSEHASNHNSAAQAALYAAETHESLHEILIASAAIDDLGTIRHNMQALAEATDTLQAQARLTKSATIAKSKSEYAQQYARLARNTTLSGRATIRRRSIGNEVRHIPINDIQRHINAGWDLLPDSRRGTTIKMTRPIDLDRLKRPHQNPIRTSRQEPQNE